MGKIRIDFLAKGGNDLDKKENGWYTATVVLGLVKGEAIVVFMEVNILTTGMLHELNAIDWVVLQVLYS